MSLYGFPLLLAERTSERAPGSSFWFPPQASTFAKDVDSLYMYIGYISAFFFVVVVAAMVWFSIKYRRRPGYEGDSTALHNNALEIFWTVVPTIIVVWIFAEGVKGYMDMMTPPAQTIDVNVTARKWGWTFQYPNGAISDKLHVPINKASKMRLRSEDALHAFYVPAFRCKTDVVPGRVTYAWFQPIMEGTFDLFCAEYCGDEHSNMITTVTVHSEESYQNWLKEAAKPPENIVAHGQWLYERQGCKGCHSMEPGKKIVGPSFAESFGTDQKIVGGTVNVDAGYIRESILEPQKKIREGFQGASQMPSYQGKLKDDEILALTAFIEALKDGKLTDDELGKNDEKPAAGK
ncbi:MAG: cytochrome c oxidase subunit II [Pirellulaceae bacterium]|nr:cytochrome c oxidase subunit II [Pirellulaceae bacterium]